MDTLTGVRHRHIGRGYMYNDTQRAHSIEPWEECCSSGEECVCVTQDDVDRWNVIDSISSLTGVDFSSYSAYSALATSADIWNGVHDTVCANSAVWNEASAVGGLSALDTMNSAYWESASNVVCANSGKWNAHGEGIDANSARIDELSAEFGKAIKLYFDGDSITGDGTENSPYAVKDYDELVNLLNDYVTKVRPLYRADGSQNWMTLDAADDSKGINPYLKSLFDALADKDNEQDITLNSHGNLIQWIIKHLNTPYNPSGDDITWVYETDMSKSAIAGYNELATMYFCGYDPNIKG